MASRRSNNQFTIAAQQTEDLCPDATTTYDMLQCYSAAFDKIRSGIARVVSLLGQRLETRESVLLTRAQEGWASYRDAQCDCEAAAHEGGSLEGVLSVSCKAFMETERLETLKKTYRSELENPRLNR